MKYLNLIILTVFVFFVAISSAFANPIKVFKEAREEITGVAGKTGEYLTKQRIGELNRDIRIFIKEKPVSDIVKDLSDDFVVSPEDVLAGLYSYAKRKTDFGSEMSGQELQNVEAVMDAVVPVLEKGDTKQVRIGDFDFVMTDVISSPALSIKSVFGVDTMDTFAVPGVEMVVKYIAGNLSDFTKDGAQALVRFFDHSRHFRFYGRLHVFQSIEIDHLIGNHELLLRLFQLEYERGKLAGFILSKNDDFRETVIVASRDNREFSEYVDSVLKNKPRQNRAVRSDSSLNRSNVARRTRRAVRSDSSLNQPNVVRQTQAVNPDSSDFVINYVKKSLEEDLPGQMGTLWAARVETPLWISRVESSFGKWDAGEVSELLEYLESRIGKENTVEALKFPSSFSLPGYKSFRERVSLFEADMGSEAVTKKMVENPEFFFSQKAYEKLQQETGDFVRSLTPSDIMDDIESLYPVWARFFTVEHLRPAYSKIGPDGYTNNSYLARPTMTSGHYNRTELVRSIAFLPVEGVRKLRKGSDSYKAYGPLPHLPPEYVPYLELEVISGLRKSIRYLADRVEFMTKEQIQSLTLEQITVLARELKNTGKNEELSSKQLEAVRKKYPKMFRLLRTSSHNETMVNELLDKINNRSFQIAHIPVDVVKLIPPKDFSLVFLRALRKRSYTHFLEISPEQISEMEFRLQQYIIRERWNSILRTPQPEMLFRNLSVEKVKEMNPEDRQRLFDKMNLSEELFMDHLDWS